MAGIITSQQHYLTKGIWQVKVAIALQVTTELCLTPPITQPVTRCITNYIPPILHAQRWTLHVMLPDGNCPRNCLYQAFAKALFAVQSGHITQGKLLVNFIVSSERLLHLVSRMSYRLLHHFTKFYLFI